MPKNETKRESKNPSFFSSETTINQRIIEQQSPTPILQLFSQSCVPFSFATLFTKVLKEQTEPDLELEENEWHQMLRVFEIGIYPEIWEEEDGYSDKDKAIQYLLPFSSYSAEIFTEYVDICYLPPTKDKVFFILEQEGLPPIQHVVMVVTDKKEFIYEGKRYPSLKDISKDIQQVFRIDLKDMDVELIQKEYEKHLKKIDKVLRDFDESNPLHRYFIDGINTGNFPLYRSAYLNLVFPQITKRFPALAESMTLFREKIKTILLTEPEVCIYSLEDMERIIRDFPACRESLKNQFNKNPSSYIIKFQDLQTAIKIFPECSDFIKDLKNTGHDLKMSQ